MHTIWIGRNVIKFNTVNIFVHSANAKVRTTTSLRTSMCKAHVCPGSSTVVILEDLNITHVFKSSHIIKMILWQPPTHLGLKINTYGSLVGNVATCGGIFRDVSFCFHGKFL